MKWAEEFFARVHARLQAGEREYGDRSHYRPTDDLLDEIQQELEDVAGWGAILWARLDRLRALSGSAGGGVAGGGDGSGDANLVDGKGLRDSADGAALGAGRDAAPQLADALGGEEVLVAPSGQAPLLEDGAEKVVQGFTSAPGHGSTCSADSRESPQVAIDFVATGGDNGPRLDRRSLPTARAGRAVPDPERNENMPTDTASDPVVSIAAELPEGYVADWSPDGQVATIYRLDGARRIPVVDEFAPDARCAAEWAEEVAAYGYTVECSRPGCREEVAGSLDGREDIFCSSRCYREENPDV